MKNTFAVSMTLLLALTLGGSFAGYRIATTPHEKTESGADNPVTSEAAPSAQRAATGGAGPAEGQGAVKESNQGGTNTGENGAVLAPGGDRSGNGVQQNSTTEPGGGAATGGETGAANSQRMANARDNEAQEVSGGDQGAGQTLFAANCAGCHGTNGQGVVGPSLVKADGPKAWTEPEFLAVIRQGKTPQRVLNATMPRFSETQLSDAEVLNIHAYIKSLN